MRIFLNKKGKCGQIFPMCAGDAKQKINLPWPYRQSMSYKSLSMQKSLKNSKIYALILKNDYFTVKFQIFVSNLIESYFLQN